ncbi:YihY/virulence factor BrkB family protein [Salinisphaera sp.]|uniref:YihY/virulence factor BrkB family protein n=1 Tax=Salinisphaera sp. TaxID=1914330 RepID=UPI002D789110|nr:YihY/virulence factor BrkB family protein [Salinisphaera sp.]HET7312943.1 YihY/virulence factor BrkB family protein [Salinisphaera sp.]
MALIGGVGKRFDTVVWGPELERLRGPRRWFLVALRIVLTLIEDFRNGEITMRAMGLVYTTLVSLVPLLALAFSLLKAFGADNSLRPVLERFLAPLGGGSDQIIDKIVGFVQNVQVGVLGAIGVVTLIYSVISLIQKVEAGCNYIWHVRKPRSIGRRVTEYLSVLVAGPLVILAAASMTATITNNSTVAWLTSIEPFGSALYLGGRILPYVLYGIGFTLLFKFIPNTQVRVLPALGGGIFSGVLWQTASLGFAVFAKSAGNVNAIYSSFAILILLLIWLYVSWMILLLGCRVAFLLQHNERLTRGHYPPRLGAAERERLALLITALVAARFIRGDRPWTVAGLAHTLRAAPDHIQDIADQLVAGDLLVEIGDIGTPLLPRRDIAEVRLLRVLDIVRAGEAAARAAPRDLSVARAVDALAEDVEHARRKVYAERSLRDLALALRAERETTDRQLPDASRPFAHATDRHQV